MLPLRIFLAALTAFLFGGFYCSPGCALGLWTRASERGGRRFDKNLQGHSPLVFALAFLAAVVAAHTLDEQLALRGLHGDAVASAAASASLGLTLVASTLAIQCSFGAWPLQLWLVDATYHVAQFALAGACLSHLKGANL